MELNKLRKEIDKTDNQIVDLFLKRTELSKKIGIEKKKTGKAVNDPQRERDVLYRLTSLAPENMESSIKYLYETIFALSKTYQTDLNYADGEIHSLINNAIINTPKNFPSKAVVACQGIEGSYSQLACNKLFSNPSILYFNSLDEVFTAIENGICQYGIIPIENNKYSSVSKVYDLMHKHCFYTVKCIKLKIEDCLLTKKGIKLNDIKENIQNNSFYFTRYICISKNPEIYEDANKMSMMLQLEHKPGTLLQVMSKFAALGINLTKLESSPVPENKFVFDFYFDFDASPKNTSVVNLLEELNSNTRLFTFLGSYSEI